MTNTTADGGWNHPSGPPQRFTDTLDELRQTGCVVLVTGDVDETVRATISRRLFGASELSRQRVIVCPAESPLPPSSYLPHGNTSESTNVQYLEWIGLRGTEATARERVPEQPPNLGALSEQLAGVLVDTAQTEGRDKNENENGNRNENELSPGELRVGVLPLDLILGQYGRAATTAFLSTLGRRVRSFHGIGHCHLPVSSDSTVAKTLAGDADIHIRLRNRTGTLPEQRWYLCNTDRCSAWMSLDL